MSQRAGWKVVRVIGARDGVLWSACIEDAAIRYRPGEWARPLRGAGPLCVFRAPWAATRFAREMSKRTRGYGALAVWRCHWYPSRSREVWTPSGDRMSWEQLPSLLGLASRVRLSALVAAYRDGDYVYSEELAALDPTTWGASS